MASARATALLGLSAVAAHAAAQGSSAPSPAPLLIDGLVAAVFTVRSVVGVNPTQNLSRILLF